MRFSCFSLFHLESYLAYKNWTLSSIMFATGSFFVVVNPLKQALKIKTFDFSVFAGISPAVAFKKETGL